jgi:hypothetical protein
MYSQEHRRMPDLRLSQWCWNINSSWMWCCVTGQVVLAILPSSSGSSSQEHTLKVKALPSLCNTTNYSPNNKVSYRIKLCSAEVHKSKALGQLNFVQWHLILVGHKYGICSCHPSGTLNLEVAPGSLDNLWTPDLQHWERTSGRLFYFEYSLDIRRSQK